MITWPAPELGPGTLPTLAPVHSGAGQWMKKSESYMILCSIKHASLAVLGRHFKEKGGLIGLFEVLGCLIPISNRAIWHMDILLIVVSKFISDTDCQAHTDTLPQEHIVLARASDLNSVCTGPVTRAGTVFSLVEQCSWCWAHSVLTQQ